MSGDCSFLTSACLVGLVGIHGLLCAVGGQEERLFVFLQPIPLPKIPIAEERSRQNRVKRPCVVPYSRLRQPLHHLIDRTAPHRYRETWRPPRECPPRSPYRSWPGLQRSAQCHPCARTRSI